MAFGRFDSRPNAAPMADINMVPLIDVMLVLLVIFIVTAPLLTHAVKIDLPRATSGANETRHPRIDLAVDAAGTLTWNGEAVTEEALSGRFAAAAADDPQPELHLRADRDARYETVAQVMSRAAQAGLTRIGFITDPGRR